MTQEQRDILKAYYSTETTDEIQPNFDDIKINADNIDLIKTVANAILTSVFSTINDNFNDIKINADNIDSIIILSEIKNTLTSLVADKATHDSLFADKVTLDSIYALKTKIDSLFADKAKLDSIYTDKAKLDSIYEKLSDITIAVDNIIEIQDASTNAQTATTKASEAEVFRDEAEVFKNQAQAIAGGDVLADIVKFLDSTDLETYRANIDNSIVSIDTSISDLEQVLTNLIGGAPEALDTIAELAAALDDDENFATTVLNQLSQKANTSDMTIALSEKLAIADAGVNSGLNTQDPDDAAVEYIMTNHINTPNNSYYWHIRTQFYNIKTSISNRAQIAIRYGSGGSSSVYTRSCYNNVWSEWEKAVTASDVQALHPTDALSFSSGTLTLNKADGTYEQVIIPDTNTWRDISDSVSTTNGAISASLTAVKTAYNLADTAYSIASSKLSQVPLTSGAIGTDRLCKVDGTTVGDGVAINGGYLYTGYFTAGGSWTDGALNSGIQTWRNMSGATVVNGGIAVFRRIS